MHIHGGLPAVGLRCKESGSYAGSMLIRPCPTCRTPVAWEANTWRPFCSERCKIQDLGAWSSEAFRIPENPSEENGEGWSDAEIPPQ